MCVCSGVCVCVCECVSVWCNLGGESVCHRENEKESAIKSEKVKECESEREYKKYTCQAFLPEFAIFPHGIS